MTASGGGPPPGPDAPRLVASVAVDVSLPHLDKPFDYLVPDQMADLDLVGARVRVRFAGRLVSGWVLGVSPAEGRAQGLAELVRLVSPEPIMTPAVAAMLRQVADHYAGTLADVARLAIPPRHATTEAAPRREWPAPRTDHAPRLLSRYPDGAGYCEAVRSGGTPRASWLVAPVAGGPGDWEAGLAEAAAAALDSGRSAIVVAPGHKEAMGLHARFSGWFGPGALACLTHERGPSARYRAYLACSRGQARLVVGTRSAVYAPMAGLGLIAVFDDGDDLLSEPRAPYPHARQVAALRSASQRCALLFASRARTPQIADWTARGWLRPIGLTPAEHRRLTPVVRISGDSEHALERDPRARTRRLPAQVFETVRAGLAAGPVLVQVPRAGLGLGLACADCRRPACCESCGHRLRERADGGLECGWCGVRADGWACECGSSRPRAPVVGATRTTAELARAFPDAPVIESSGEQVVDEAPEHPAIVVATPGAEPPAPGGYACAVLLDTAQALNRPDLRAVEEATRRWLNAIGLVRGPDEGGGVLAVGDSWAPALQDLVRGDPAGAADRELAARFEAGYPPATRMVAVSGPGVELDRFLAEVDPPAEVLGPVDRPIKGRPDNRVALLRCAPERARALNEALVAAFSERSARKRAAGVRARVDPIDFG